MMQKVALTNLDLDLYSETLENGLSIFVVPKKNCNNIYRRSIPKFVIINDIINYKNTKCDCK